MPLLSTSEVAVRLGVKPTTVYAYVSRGLLSSKRNADGKGSLFDRSEVDRFVAARRRTTTPGIQTGITLIREGGLFYRGRDACALAASLSFESVVSLLWTGEQDRTDFVAPPALLAIARSVNAALPPGTRITDRLRVIVAAAAAADPLRFDTGPQAVVATGRALLATMITTLPPRADSLPAQGVTPVALGAYSAALAMWDRLTSPPPATARGQSFGTPSKADIRVVNAALVLLADHDIAASTLAARVAASTRAHPYAVVSAGLAALDGPLHGGASGLAYELLADALTRDDPVATVTDRLRTGAPVPGFGHGLYPAGDPRATALFRLLPDGPARQAATRIADAIRSRSGTAPNIDFALATLALHYGMPADAGEAIFAVARTAGWIAHALEEYADRPSRFRFSGQYSGQVPPTP